MTIPKPQKLGGGMTVCNYWLAEFIIIIKTFVTSHTQRGRYTSVRSGHDCFLLRIFGRGTEIGYYSP